MYQNLSPIDQLLSALGTGLHTVFATPSSALASPAEPIAEAELSAAERRHAAGLMRINHVGEVCAQALYSGQALFARDVAQRYELKQAQVEEQAHLAWCQQRLDELGARPSWLNPLWYGGAFAIGAGAALVGDKVSLSFVVETERQVEAHLGEHLERLPAADAKSRAIVQQMQADEAAHAASAELHGGQPLPMPVAFAMRHAANVMKWVAYRV
jgi:3-demethoxyubiquinol 3-hydroxylase